MALNKEKEISKYLNSIKISLQIELLGKITGNILFFWIVIWFAAIFLIYIFQIPNYFWKYSNFAMLILGTVLFIKKKNRNISLLFNHHKKQNFIYAFLIKHLPQKEDYLIYNEFKNKTNEKNFIWRAAFKQLLMQQNVSDFEKIVKDRKNGIRVVKFILLIIVSFIILVLSLNISKKVNHFWLHPLTEYIEPTPFQFKNLVKTKKIFEGDSIYFKVAIKGEDVEKAWVQVKELSTHTISRILLKEIKKMQKEDSLFKTKKITITEKIVYRYYCSTSGYLQNKKAFHSEEFSLDYIKFPKITRLEFKIVPPQYTSLKTQYYLEDHTNINCYAGSKLEIAGRISEKVDEISVIFNNTEKKSDSILEKFNFNFSIKNQGELSISYVVFDSFYLEYPVKYTINILKDENPYIQLLSPVGQIELGNDLSVNLKLKAMDDFGLSKMEMHKKRYAANVDTIKTVVDVTEWLSEKRINSIDKNLSFMDDYLLPEEKMDIFFKIYDNDVINSSKTAVSDFFTVIIPTFEQIAANVSREMQRVVSETNDIMKKSRKINSELEKIKREVRQSKEMDWEQKQKITEQLNKAKQIEESLQNIQNKIETNISRMKKNDIISPETLQKYFDLQEMFQKLLDSEFLEKMRKMEEMLNNKSSKELQKLMKQSDFSVKEFEEQIERIYELFRKVELERKLDELVQLNKKINKEQENNFNEFVNKNDQNNVNERQKQIAKDEQFLQKSMDELSKSLEEKESSLKQGLTEVDEFQKKNEILKKIQEMQESAQQKNKSDFQENHSQTMPLLQERLQKLEQLKQDFVKQEKNDTKNKINYIIEEMLSLSKQQENLNQSFKSISRYSSKIEELAVNQMNLNKFLLFEINKIVKLSHETFFLPMLLNQPLSKAQINMKKVISTLEERRTYQLTRQLDEIIKNINKAIFLLLQTQNSIEQSQSGTGIEQFMQQMQQMAGMQSGVNKQTMQMFQNGKHGQMPGQSDPQALVKLAAQQQAIQRSMDKLGESMTEGAGRGKSQIEKMAEEMKEIVKDLQRRKIDRKTINRQEKILSRMLDASRSIHKKDQSEKRKAEIAGEYIINVPDKIGNIIFYKNKIYEEYERALEQDLSPELKKMLKEYYDELLGKAKYQ